MVNGEVGPDPAVSHLIRLDASSVLVLRHGRWGGFAVSNEKKVEGLGWYMVPTEHKMIDMSILLRAAARTQAVDKSGKPQEDTYWCMCHQVCLGLRWCINNCCATRGAPRGLSHTLSVTRDAIRYLVAPPYRAIRCAR